MAHNFLKLNDDKTELLLKGNPKGVAKIYNIQLLVGDNAVKLSACARNLGINIDSALSLKTFISKTAASAMHSIRILSSKIRPSTVHYTSHQLS